MQSKGLQQLKFGLRLNAWRRCLPHIGIWMHDAQQARLR